MRELERPPGLPLEVSDGFRIRLNGRRQKLQSDIALQLHIPREPHHSHATASKQPDHLEAIENALPRHESVHRIRQIAGIDRRCVVHYSSGYPDACNRARRRVPPSSKKEGRHLRASPSLRETISELLPEPVSKTQAVVKLSHSLIALATFGLLPIGARAQEVSVLTSAYDGWNDCLIVRNSKVEAVIVPAVGRVMQFRFADRDDGIFWENRALD